MYVIKSVYVHKREIYSFKVRDYQITHNKRNWSYVKRIFQNYKYFNSRIIILQFPPYNLADKHQRIIKMKLSLISRQIQRKWLSPLLWLNNYRQ